MKPFKTVVLILVAGLLFGACAAGKKRKSANYYREHKSSLDSLRSLYDELYHHQAFSAGFTDKSYKYFVMEVITDTVRYIYNTEKNQPQVIEMISKFQYDKEKIRRFGELMKANECLWLSKSSFYANEKRETVTYLSFKSAATDRPFVENKYYVLIFMDHPITSTGIRQRIKDGELVKIDELVYFTIGNAYR
jgi:hypothetical protein